MEVPESQEKVSELVTVWQPLGEGEGVVPSFETRDEQRVTLKLAGSVVMEYHGKMCIRDRCV